MGVNPARIAASYDAIAEKYLASKPPLDDALLARLQWLVDGLAPNCQALDLGCGAGHPVLAWLSGRVHATGVDISGKQLQLARRIAPDALLLQADVVDLELPPESFEAIAALYSIIHVPREKQPGLLEQVYRWLKPGGRFLATMAVEEWEGVEPDWEGWGAEMAWSHFGAAKNLAIIQDAGLRVVTAERVDALNETWLWVQAVRPG